MSNNERPPGNTNSIKFTPKLSLLPIGPKIKQRRRRSSFVLMENDTNYIHHNRQTLFNITTASPRPVTDGQWVKSIRKSAAFQKSESFDAGDPSGSMENTSQSLWKHRPSTSVALESIDFSNFSGEISVNTSYSYCRACHQNSTQLVLRGKDLRPHTKGSIITN